MNFNKVKEIWKDNKKEYLISCLVIISVSLLILSKNSTPLNNLIVVIPFAFISTFILMSLFSYIMFGGKE